MASGGAARLLAGLFRNSLPSEREKRPFFLLSAPPGEGVPAGAPALQPPGGGSVCGPESPGLSPAPRPTGGGTGDGAASPPGRLRLGEGLGRGEGTRGLLIGTRGLAGTEALGGRENPSGKDVAVESAACELLRASSAPVSHDADSPSSTDIEGASSSRGPESLFGRESPGLVREAKEFDRGPGPGVDFRGPETGGVWDFAFVLLPTLLAPSFRTPFGVPPAVPTGLVKERWRGGGTLPVSCAAAICCRCSRSSFARSSFSLRLAAYSVGSKTGTFGGMVSLIQCCEALIFIHIGVTFGSWKGCNLLEVPLESGVQGRDGRIASDES